MVVDYLNKNLQTSNISNKKFKGDLFRSKDIFLLKPSTFMNLSGESVLAVKEYYNIEKVVAIHDDLELSLGAVRFKLGGGHGGHNGLRSLDEKIGKEYYRIRVGIGRPEHKSQVSSYVLSDFDGEEKELVEKVIEHCGKAAISFEFDNLAEIQQKYTTKKIQ